MNKAVLAGVQVLIGIAGPSSSGKTLSALRLAKGLSGDKPFVFIDTENGRALHYADDFDFFHVNLDEPFAPAHYREVIADAAKENPPVIVIDSMTHEHAGQGGVLAMHEAELDRRAGDDWKKREALNMSAWIKPKAERKLLIADLLRLRCHVILCFRAEEKVDIVPDPQKPGKTKIVPKRTVAGHVGWIPVCGKEYPYELTLSLVVTPDAPGVAKPIKIMDKHKPFVPLDQPLSEETGRLLALWAAGSSGEPTAETPAREDAGGTPVPQTGPPEFASPDEIIRLSALMVGASSKPGETAAFIEAHATENAPAEHLAWLRESVAARKLEEAVA